MAPPTTVSYYTCDGETMYQAVTSIALYVSFLIVLLPAYGGVSGKNYSINIAPRSQYVIVLTALFLVLAVALHPFVDSDSCEAYGFWVHMNGAVLLSSMYTMGLRFYFGIRQLYYGASPAAGENVVRAGRLQRLGDFVALIYQSDWYTGILWFISSLLVGSIGFAMQRGLEPTDAYPYCRLAPSSNVAAAAFGINLIGMMVLMLLMVGLRKSHAAIWLWLFYCMSYCTLLTLALVSYVSGWERLEGISWDTPFFFAMLYLYSLLFTLVVPIWVSWQGTFYRVWMHARRRLSTVFTYLRRYRREPAMTLAPIDDDIDGDDDEIISIEQLRDGRLVEVTVPPPVTSTSATAIPAAIADYIARQQHRGFLLDSPPAPSVDIKVEDVIGAVLVMDAAGQLAERTGMSSYLALLQLVLPMVGLKRSQHVSFNAGIEAVYAFVRDHGIKLPGSVNAALALGTPVDDLRTETDARAPPPQMPRYDHDMRRRIYPLIRYIQFVLRAAIKYDEIASHGERPLEHAAEWVAFAATDEVELAPLAPDAL
jgi:hypothetical protein